jgi:hypothetical protein
MKRTEIWGAIEQERVRQEHLKETGKFRYTCADPEMTDEQRYCVLAEEIGEVARAVLNRHDLARDGFRDLQKELIQSAAVIGAWLETFPSEVGGARG